MTPEPGRPAPPLVSAMFGRIAARYDLMNVLITGGQDHRWRLAAVWAASPPPDGLALDVGTGTARLAATLVGAVPRGRVVGLDFTEPMLRIGQRWLWATDRLERVMLVAGDALCLPFPDASFDSVTSAFTMRNLPDLERGFREQARVVRPGGRVVCLELTWPRSRLGRLGLDLYGGLVVPRLGRLVAGDGAAYGYLPASMQRFPSPERLAEIMVRSGLRAVRWRRLGFGTVTLHVAERTTELSRSGAEAVGSG